MGITRHELYTSLGLLKPVEPLIKKIFQEAEQEAWENDIGNAPHGHHWHTSFHASQFPADDPKACGRKALYTMMKIPQPKPTDYQLRLIGDIGKALETIIVSRFEEAGILLSAGPFEKVQTGFKDPDTWLSGNVDAIILPPQHGKGHVVEIKGKDHDIVTAMKMGERPPDPAHRKQCLTYIWMANQASPFLWPELDPVTTGSICYFSRQRPGHMHEFTFTLDEEAIKLGRAKLKEWQEAFLSDTLPPRPSDWKWTDEPCKYCDFKNAKLADGTKVGCKVDDIANVDTLHLSSLTLLAKELDPIYDFDRVRQAVIDRWT